LTLTFNQKIDIILNKKSTILLVDDAPQNIDVLKGILASEYKIQVATHAEQALKICAKSPPDLILLDIIMPGMSGHITCIKLKENPRTQNIPVIFVTGMEDEEDEVKGFALGAVDYITKPVSPAIVRARVKTHLMLQKKSNALECMSSMDALTNICNRRRFDEVFKREWHQGIRNTTPISMIFSDVDSFKAYNDHYGHTDGDGCLTAVARALNTSLSRETDLLARYGGEEFIAILPDTSLKSAAVLAEKMRKNVAKLKISHAYSLAAKHVTVSLGVACMQPESGMLSDTLIKAADSAVYQAKEHGRNQVQCYSVEGKS